MIKCENDSLISSPFSVIHNPITMLKARSNLRLLVEEKSIKQYQEIIKVREWIPHTGPLAKVIRLKLFLDIVPSSFADITHALRGCFRGGSVYVSFRFVLKQSKVSNSVKMSSLIFWLQAKELRLTVCRNTFRNFNGGLNKRRTYPAQTITIEWTAEKCLDKWQTTNKPPNTS